VHAIESLLCNSSSSQRMEATSGLWRLVMIHVSEDQLELLRQ